MGINDSTEGNSAEDKQLLSGRLTPLGISYPRWKGELGWWYTTSRDKENSAGEDSVVVILWGICRLTGEEQTTLRGAADFY